MKGALMVVVGWLAWIYLTVAIFTDAKQHRLPSVTRIAVLATPALLAQLVCYWTLIAVLMDHAKAVLLLRGSVVGAAASAMLVATVARRQTRGSSGDK